MDNYVFAHHPEITAEYGERSDGETFEIFIIVKKSFWDEYKGWDPSGVIPKELNEHGFYEWAESQAEYDGDPEEGKQKLIEAGLVEDLDLVKDSWI